MNYPFIYTYASFVFDSVSAPESLGLVALRTCHYFLYYSPNTYLDSQQQYMIIVIVGNILLLCCTANNIFLVFCIKEGMHLACNQRGWQGQMVLRNIILNVQ